MKTAQKIGLSFYALMRGHSQDVSARIGCYLITVTLRCRQGVFFVETLTHPGAGLDIHTMTPSLTDARASFGHALSVAFSHEYRLIRRKPGYRVTWEADAEGFPCWRAYSERDGLCGRSPVKYGAWLACYDHWRKAQIALYQAVTFDGFTVAGYARDKGLSRSAATRLILGAKALYNEERQFYEQTSR